MNLFSIKGVCVEQPKVQLNHRKVAGLTVLATKELQPLKVVFSSDVPFFGTFVSVQPGDEILVAAEHLSAQRWAKEIYEFSGRSFVVVPYDVILGVATSDTDPTVGSPAGYAGAVAHMEEK